MKLDTNDHLIEEKILSEERVFEGKLVKVGLMQVTLPDGKPALREAVRHMGARCPMDTDLIIAQLSPVRKRGAQLLPKAKNHAHTSRKIRQFVKLTFHYRLLWLL
jgi:hypothetical protein